MRVSERMKTLNTLKQQLPVLECNPGPNCWCAKISFLFEDVQDDGLCYSPKEILDMFGDNLSNKDRKYLESLLTKEFIQ